MNILVFKLKNLICECNQFFFRSSYLLYERVLRNLTAMYSEDYLVCVWRDFSFDGDWVWVVRLCVAWIHWFSGQKFFSVFCLFIWLINSYMWCVFRVGKSRKLLHSLIGLLISCQKWEFVSHWIVQRCCLLFVVVVCVWLISQKMSFSSF